VRGKPSAAAERFPFPLLEAQFPARKTLRREGGPIKITYGFPPPSAPTNVCFFLDRGIPFFFVEPTLNVPPFMQHLFGSTVGDASPFFVWRGGFFFFFWGRGGFFGLFFFFLEIFYHVLNMRKTPFVFSKYPQMTPTMRCPQPQLFQKPFPLNHVLPPLNSQLYRRDGPLVDEFPSVWSSLPFVTKASSRMVEVGPPEFPLSTIFRR